MSAQSKITGKQGARSWMTTHRTLTNLLKMYTITVHNKSAPAVVEAMPVSAVTGADYILSEKAKKGVAGTQSDRRARRKELMRTYLINNQVPPVLKGSKLSYRIPANTNADEIIPGPVIQTLKSHVKRQLKGIKIM